jgi:hypothetical protein
VDYESRFGFVPDPPANDPYARFGFVPEGAPSSSDSRFGFVEESPADLHQRVWAFKQTPTDYEIGRLIDAEAQRKKDQTLLERGGEFLGNVGAGAMGLYDVVKKGVTRPFTQEGVGFGDAVQSVAEGLTRADLRLGKQIVDKLTPESDFVDVPGDLPRRMTDAEKRDRAIYQYRADWEEKRKEATQTPEEARILPKVFGKLDPAIVDAASLLDPTIFLGGGAALEAEAPSLIRRGIAMAAEKAGGITEAGAGKALAAIKGIQSVPSKIAERILTPGSEEAAQLGSSISKVGTLAAASGAGALGIASPPILGALAATAAAAPVAKVTGQALSAVGRNLLEPSYSAQLGLLGNIARDPNASRLIRGAAQFGQFADPALSLAGRTAEGALHGAAAAGALTAALGGDEEQIAQATGGGGLIGGTGRAVTGALPSARRAAVEADMARWKAPMSAEVRAAIDGMAPDQQARVMNAHNFISGLGDVDFRYLTPDQWKNEGLPPGRAMQTTQGDRPIVNINVKEIGNGAPVLHESGHVLRALYPDEFKNLDQHLFTDFTVPQGTGTDFTTGHRETSKGLLSPDQQQRLYDQYFSKLDPAVQELRRSTWSPQDHLNSLRDEVSSELLSNLLQDKRPNYLLNLGGVKNGLMDRLALSTERSLLSRLPGVQRLKQSTGPTGSTLFKLDGQPLRVDGRTAAGLRKILRVRDRAVDNVFVGKGDTGTDTTGITGRVGVREMLGPDRELIAKQYGNSDTYKKDAAGNVQFNPDGSPVLLDEGAVRKLHQARADAVAKALAGTPSGPADSIVVGNRQIDPVRLNEKGNWEGNHFTDAQLAALDREVPKNILTPQQLAHIRELNDAIRAGTGIRKALDYNPATKEKGLTGRRAYAPQGSKFYETVPYAFFVNKEGGLSVRNFDVGAISRKLNRWMEGPTTKRHLAIWNGDRNAVMRDVYKYLDNQAKGLPNSLHLDANPAFAVQKRNLITDLLGGLNVEKGQIASPLSTKAGRDNAYKLFRIDRINQLSPSNSENFPVIHERVKQNLMPQPVTDASTGPLPHGVTPDAVIKHTQVQATQDLKTKLVGGGAPPALADEIAATAWKKAEKAARRQSAPSERAYTVRTAERLNQLGPSDLEAIRAATIKGGTNGAAKEIEKRLLAPPRRGQRIPIRVK